MVSSQLICQIILLLMRPLTHYWSSPFNAFYCFKVQSTLPKSNLLGLKKYLRLRENSTCEGLKTIEYKEKRTWIDLRLRWLFDLCEFDLGRVDCMCMCKVKVISMGNYENSIDTKYWLSEQLNFLRSMSFVFFFAFFIVLICHYFLTFSEPSFILLWIFFHIGYPQYSRQCPHGMVWGLQAPWLWCQRSENRQARGTWQTRGIPQQGGQPRLLVSHVNNCWLHIYSSCSLLPSNISEEVTIDLHVCSIYSHIIVLVDLNEFTSICEKCIILTADIRKQPQTSLESFERADMGLAVNDH